MKRLFFVRVRKRRRLMVVYLLEQIYEPMQALDKTNAYADGIGGGLKNRLEF